MVHRNIIGRLTPRGGPEFWTIFSPTIIGLKRIFDHYNSAEILQAKKEKREPVILPRFSCHVLRHTFATRLCEAESNLKVIQSVMGHKSVETTMDIYAEATNRRKQESFENLSAKLDNIF